MTLGTMFGGLILVATLVGAPAPAAAPLVTPLEAPPHLVLAQRLVEFTDGSYTWAHTAHDVGSAASTIDTAAPTMVLARGDGSAALEGSDGSRVLLGDGEGTASPEQSRSWTAIALAESGGSTTTTVRLDFIAVVPAESGGGFAPGAGWHDVELRYVELLPGTTLQAPPPGNPALVLVIAGTVVDAAGASIETDGTVQLGAADARVTNVGGRVATVIIAVIGPALDLGADEAPVVDEPSEEPSTTEQPATPTTEAAIDIDGDGLSDDDEAALGTDHNDADSDDDELSDGEEVNTHLTNPLDKDTDGDELPDAGEVVLYGTDPHDQDTDDDGLLDIEPVNWGTGPTNPDTDDDGLNDGAEVNDFGSNPHVTDSDGDSLTDGDEVNTWGSDPTDTDSDGDTLVDGEEVNGTHTDPADDDTDGDTIDDGTEAGNGTDPNDANDP